MGVEWWEAELWGSRVVTKQNRGSIIVVLELSMSRIVVQNWEAGAVTAFSRWSKTGNLNIQYYKLHQNGEARAKTARGRLETITEHRIGKKRHMHRIGRGWPSGTSSRNVTHIESVPCSTPFKSFSILSCFFYFTILGTAVRGLERQSSSLGGTE